MKASQSTINDFFSMGSTMFSIPTYQRNYTWKKHNCTKLLEDIISISRNKKTHFMGSITYVIHLKDQENSLMQLQEFVIIDGQQRITTMMLLLKAIETKASDEIKEEIAKLLSLTRGQKLRLKPIKSDREAFDLVMSNRLRDIQGSSKIKENYQFFLKELDSYLQKGYAIEEIYRAFLRLKIVGIGLELGDDDPQVVFESINATGVQLTGLDLIRNYLMMGEDSTRQDWLYETYWIPLEEWLGVKDLNEFIITYLRIYYEDRLKEEEREIYYLLKSHHREHFPNDIEALMADMRGYGRIYQVFLEGHHNGLERSDVSSQDLAHLRKAIGILVQIKFGVAKPFVLRCARDFEEGRLGYDDFYEILQILVSYYVRRSVCKEPTMALNRILYTLYNSLGEVCATNLKQFLGKQFGRGIFPNDDRIKDAFATRNAYSLKSVCKFILLEIEKLSNAEPPREEELEVEHFYPQSPTQEWRDMVGEEYVEFEDKYLNTFGNLTLTGQNQKLSNKSYDEKIQLLDSHSSLHLNDYFINNTDSWGISEVLSRAQHLAESFCEIEIFKDLPKDYRIRELRKSLDSDLTFVKLSRISLPNGEKHYARNGSYLAKAVIDYLLENAREAFETYTSEYLPRYIYRDSAQAGARRRDGTLVVPFEKAGFYFVSNAALKSVGSNLKDLVQGCKLDPSAFVIE
ncbi:DUF262 domain-containing protein [Helicobacter sp. XJK30-2]|uniref:DUF262 domain-containing protein n=1 Tax=Helicobacter zhangjianzhongii TaxID=2974574 RepID=A0ACC6FSF3_9HELI|nr:DUF262 domain-containing protein [Helicobacter sp. XJK30-2]MDL0082206.1 DUF262 domain-containing protein [Helicobacter sp. XJK30-2]